MRYLEHVTTDGERWDNLAGAITAMRWPTNASSRPIRTSLLCRFYRQACG